MRTIFEIPASSGDGGFQVIVTDDQEIKNYQIVVSYLKKLLDNARVVRYLSRNHPEILTEFQKLVEERNLNNGTGEGT